MKRVLCVWLPHWPLQHWGETHPELKTETLAVALYEEASRGALRIVECSAAAWARRIRPGMSLAEATALANPPAGKNRPASSSASTSPMGQRARRDSAHASPPALQAADALRLERYDPLGARAALVELAGWCEQFSPSVGLEEGERPESLLLDVTGLGHLFGGEENLCAQVAQAFAGRGLQIRLALADTIAAAWALAHYAQAPRAPGVPRVPGMLVPPGEGWQAVAPLPITALRLGAEAARLLAELGLEQIGQLQAIPRAALGTRFGSELLRRWDQLTGEADEVIRAEEPPAELQAIWSSEYPVSRSDVIEAVVERLLTQVAEALALQGRGVVRLTCQLRGAGRLKETGPLGGVGKPNSQFLLALFRPSATGRHLFELARLQLERLRLTEAVTEIIVSVTASDLLECRQEELFAADGGREDRRQLAGLVDRLASRLGRERVLRARPAHDAQPELACRYEPLTGASARRSQRENRRAPRGNSRAARSKEQPSRREPSPETSSKWPQAKRPRRETGRTEGDSAQDDRRGRGFQWSERPLRLAPQPAPLEVIALAPDGPPVRFCLCGQTHLIARAWGPERIETGWWRGRPVRRDYYRVETEAGLRHWLFRRLADGHWFWHGEFD